ncbi:MAG: alginate export family protein [Deltaproteobacteria bacterium]|nr:alginate export family protein [Deltaproteobacteria bacterium]
MENNPQKDHLELYHTYLQLSNINGLPLEMTIGRQKIAYGDNRVFGPGEWGNSGKWVWDAAKISYARGDHFVEMFYGANMLHDPDKFSLSHRWGYEGLGIYGHYGWKKGGIEPILAYKHNDNGNASFNSLKHYYIGFRVYDDDVAGFFYNGTFIRQLGKQISLSGVKRDVDAYGWHLDAGYSFKMFGENAKIGAAFSYATGDDKSTQDIERFDGAFGAADNFYGRMNLMSWSNLKDAELFFIFSPARNLKIKAEYHHFRMEEKNDKWGQYENSASVNDSHLGDEIDIVATYDHSRNIQFQTGYGRFRPGNFIKGNIPSGRSSDWFFLQTDMRF